MKLKEAQWCCPSSIKCTAYFPDAESFKNVLVLKFRGVYPPGSLGNEHANYILYKTMEALYSFDPDGIVLDFSELEYVWGNSILQVFQEVAQVKYDPEEPECPSYPLIILVGEKSQNGLMGLFGIESLDQCCFMYDCLDVAVVETYRQYNLWLKY